jgi:putative phosphonate metabolism protein
VTNFKRFAIYYAPEPGPLAEFGANWLGWDLAHGIPAPHPHMDGLDIPALTATPRKYGLHGTVKPPFVLAQGTDFPALAQATETLCARLPAATLDGLALTRLGGFLALTVTGDTAALSALAAQVVEGLDSFRAPPSDAELARRRKANLSPQQDTLLTRWGYPYVMEEFRFHITLTGKMPRDTAETIRQRLEPIARPLLPNPFTVTSLCLVGEDENGMFHLIHRYALSG